MDLLRATYDKIRVQHPKLTFESYEVVKLVNDYRLYWKPRRVKTILLAESHVYTHDAETENRHWLNLPGYPDRYVRFVYNLSYGQQQPFWNTLFQTTRVHLSFGSYLMRLWADRFG